MAKTQEPAPELSEILKLKSALEIEYQEEDKQIAWNRQVRTMEQPLGIPADLMVADTDVRDPTVTDEIARVVATMAKHDPLWNVIPVAQTDDAEEASTRIEKWTARTLMAAATRVPGMNTYRAMWDACMGDGGGCSKLLFMPDTWEERYGIKLAKYLKQAGDNPDAQAKARAQYDEDTEQAKRRAGSPYAWVPVDVATVYPVWDGGVQSEVLEVQHRKRIPAFTKNTPELGWHVGQPLSRDEATGSGVSDYICFEHWTRTWVTYGSIHGGGDGNASILKQWEHGYGTTPYVWAPGLLMNHWRGRKVGSSIGWSKLLLSQARSMFMTLAVQDAIRQMSLPIGMIRPDSAEPIVGDDGQVVDFRERTFNLNRIIEMGPGVDWKKFPQDPIAPALKDALTMIAALEATLDTPRVSNDIGGAVAGAGFAMTTQITEAKTKHDPFIKAMEQMVKDVTHLLWHIQRTRVHEKSWIWANEEQANGSKKTVWLGVSDKDLQQVVDVEVTIDPDDTSAQLVKVRTLKEMVEAGFLDQDSAIAELGYNPDEVRFGQALTRMRNEGWYQGMQSMEVLQTVGAGDVLHQAASQAAMSGQLPGMPPALAQHIAASRQMATMQQSMNPQGPPAPAPSGPSRELPDQGSLAMSPNAAGAAPGGIPGAGPGTVVPQQAAAASNSEGIGP